AAAKPGAERGARTLLVAVLARRLADAEEALGPVLEAVEPGQRLVLARGPVAAAALPQRPRQAIASERRTRVLGVVAQEGLRFLHGHVEQAFVHEPGEEA